MLIRAALLAWVEWITKNQLPDKQRPRAIRGAFSLRTLVCAAPDPDITPHALTTREDDAVVPGAGGFLYHRRIGWAGGPLPPTGDAGALRRGVFLRRAAGHHRDDGLDHA